MIKITYLIPTAESKEQTILQRVLPIASKACYADGELYKRLKIKHCLSILKIWPNNKLWFMKIDSLQKPRRKNIVMKKWIKI